MKRILATIALVVLAAGQSCEQLENLLPGGGLAGESANDPHGINALPDSGMPIPEIGVRVSLQIINDSGDDAVVLARFLVGPVEVRRTQLRVPAGASLEPIGPDLAAIVEVSGEFSSGTATPTARYEGGVDFDANDKLIYRIPGVSDDCPADAAKDAPGQCGCGTPDTDSDGDGAADCNDNCPADAAKVNPGICGCGTADTDSDGDQVPDCRDECPGDAAKTAPGICGCGAADVDTDQDQVLDCQEACPEDPYKTDAGVCGCGEPDFDYDGDGAMDCVDACPMDKDKIAPGVCGCNRFETTGDYDYDGVIDCLDNCIDIPNPEQMDADNDGIGDVCDYCIDTDYDGYGDPGYYGECSIDNCPAQYNPDQTDTNGDGIGDACEPRTVIEWMSTRMHGGTTPLSIPIDPYGGTGDNWVSVETRQGGIQQIDVLFNGPMTLLHPEWIEVLGLTTIEGTPAPRPIQYTPTAVSMVNSTTMKLEFEPGLLPDETCYTIDVGSAFLEPVTNGTVRVIALLGDVDGNAVVDQTDDAMISDLLSGLLWADYAPSADVDLSGGYIDIADRLLVQSRITIPAREAFCELAN